MSVTINEFTPGLVLPQYVTTDYDPVEDIALLAKKQDEYNKVMDKVKGLQQQALNVQMLNNEGKQRLSAYNQQLNDLLSQDLGDLTDIANQNRVAGFFQNLTSDTSLIKTSQMSAKYQEQIDLIEEFRRSGKKGEGYSATNELVFLEWDGGLYDFMGSSLDKVTSSGFKPEKFTPYKELDTKTLNIMKTLHESGDSTTYPTGGAYMITKGEKGVTPERIRAMMLSTFDQEDLDQLDVLAKYEVIKARKSGETLAIGEKYSMFADAEIKRTEGEADKAKQRISYFQSILDKKDATLEEKTQAQELITELTNNEKIYRDRALELRQNKKPVQDFANMSNQELLLYAKDMQWASKVNGIADAMSWKQTVTDYKMDPAWKLQKELDAMKWRETFRAETAKAIASAKAAKDKGPDYSGTMDAAPNPQDAYTQFKSLAQQAEIAGKASDNLITAGGVPPDKLNDPQWIKENGTNFEVKMWDYFKNTQDGAVVNGVPQTEKFKLWLADQLANPSGPTGHMVEQYWRDKDVSDWADAKVTEVTQAVRNASNEYDFLSGYNLYDANGQVMSKAQYDAGATAYIGLPNSQGGFTLTKLDDAITGAQKAIELESSKRKLQAESAPYTGSTSPAAVMGAAGLGMMQTLLNPISNLAGEHAGVVTGDSPYAKDQGLTQRLLQLGDKRQNKSAAVEQILTSKLPQIQQYGMQEALSDEALLAALPDVASAFKHAGGEDRTVGITLSDLDIVRVPVGGGTMGVARLKPNLNAGAFEGFKVPSVDGKTMIEATPGTMFGFTTSPRLPYDTAFNEKVNSTGAKRTYQGYTVEINRMTASPNLVAFKIYDKNGKPKDSGSLATQDASQALEVAKGYINKLPKQ